MKTEERERPSDRIWKGVVRMWGFCFQSFHYGAVVPGPFPWAAFWTMPRGVASRAEGMSATSDEEFEVRSRASNSLAPPCATSALFYRGCD